MVDWAGTYQRLRARIEASGVRVLARPMGLETTGIFDGLSITTNTAYDLETRCHNIAHSFGHIAQWCLDYLFQQRLYDDLHAAKTNKAADPSALENALRRFRAYEEEASRYAAWLLIDTGSAAALPAFTNFARADIEAIVAFHRDGAAPPWHAFFDRWNRDVKRGTTRVVPFEAKPIPPFEPRHIEPQEVIQEVDDSGDAPEGPLDVSHLAARILLRLILSIGVRSVVMDSGVRSETCPGDCGLRYVCRCLRVTEDVIVTAFATQDIRTLRDIRNHTGAGDGCMACHRRLKAYLERNPISGSLAAAVA